MMRVRLIALLALLPSSTSTHRLMGLNDFKYSVTVMAFAVQEYLSFASLVYSSGNCLHVYTLANLKIGLDFVFWRGSGDQAIISSE